MLAYEKYKEFILELLQKRIGEDVELLVIEVNKRNDSQKEAVLIKDKENTLAPIIYLDGLYEEYQRTKNPYAGLEGCAAALAGAKEMRDSSLILAWEYVRTHVRLCLVGREWNKKYLQDKVYMEMMDLALLLTVVLKHGEDGEACVTMTQGLMKQCGFSKEELFTAAEENLQKEQFHIWGMGELICAYLEETMCMDGLQETMYVISNEQKTFGARALCRKDMLGTFAEKLGGNLYIIPSSVHELILLKDDGAIDAGYLREMVYSVNQDRNAIRREDVLSDSVYYYDRGTGKIRIMD